MHPSSQSPGIPYNLPGAPGAGVCAWGFSLFHRPAAQFSQSGNHFSQARHLRLPVVPRTPVSSTPLFSSLCKIFRSKTALIKRRHLSEGRSEHILGGNHACTAGLHPASSGYRKVGVCHSRIRFANSFHGREITLDVSYRWWYAPLTVG